MRHLCFNLAFIHSRRCISAIVSLKKAGFEHYLLVMADEAGCKGLKVLYPAAQVRPFELWK